MHFERMFLFNVWMVSFSSSVRGDVRNCNDFYHPKSPSTINNFNCTWICGLRFHVPPTTNETAICEKGSTPIICVTDKNCGRNTAAYCKTVPCYCETEPNYYMHHSDLTHVSICVIPTKWSHPDMPLVPFPWLTLIVVLGILALFGLCLVVLRWISPHLRRLQSKRESRNTDMGNSTENAEASALFSALQSVPSRPSQIRSSSSHSSQGSHRPSSSRRFRARYRSWDRLDTLASSTSCAVAEDKPPPYEIAIQMQSPPSGDPTQESSPAFIPSPPADEGNSTRGNETCDYLAELPLS